LLPAPSTPRTRRWSEATAAVLCYIGAQFDHQDKLFEQLCRWSLEAGYYATRTDTDPDELLAVCARTWHASWSAYRFPAEGGARHRVGAAAPVRPQARVH